ncbi:hypothetical protein [Sulfitobacter sp. R18_1]|uniref:hypothetical protein n=1 Tax=Sulfitobacter sp. R18_1 TaxID=2821104 RepID=UPI001AD98B79|nr:hypothetical protein [Sulfitobacter sp. R18_1]MBO9427891.1 hypothetical protein [Sulfitobacter sp. R18_1]
MGSQYSFEMSEWKTEPDHIEFEASGLQALVLRAGGLGHLTGYVGVPKNHVLFGLDMGDIPSEIPAHKGWTYASDLNPATGKADGNWWIRFDCAHAGDLIPAMANFDTTMATAFARERAVYRNVDYVRKTVEQAADAVKNYMGPNVALFRA